METLPLTDSLDWGNGFVDAPDPFVRGRRGVAGSLVFQGFDREALRTDALQLGTGAVWNRVLTQDEITYLYEGALTYTQLIEPD